MSLESPQLNTEENFQSWDQSIIKKTKKLIEDKKFLTEKDRINFKEKAEKLMKDPIFIEERIRIGDWKNILSKRAETPNEAEELEDKFAEGLIWAIEDYSKETE